jgi:guanylate kinase
MTSPADHWTGPDTGALFVVTGASGTGKTTLVKAALSAIPSIGWSVSATTRGPRIGEVDGKDYHFVDHPKFDQMVEHGELLEWAAVYGNRYGTPRAPVVDRLNAGESVLLEIDRAGARQVKAAMPGAVLIFVLPPAPEVIEARLRARSTDSEAVIQRRVAEAADQLGGCGEFDYLVVNDVLEHAHVRFQGVLWAELQRKERNRGLVRRFGGV